MENEPNEVENADLPIDLLSMLVNGHPLYIAVDGAQFAAVNDRKSLYEQVLCPLRTINNALAVAYRGDVDPHGILKYHASVPRSKLEESGGINNLYALFENAFEEEVKTIDPKAIVKKHLPLLLIALQIYMGITLEVKPRLDGKGNVEGYNLVFNDGKRETIDRHDIPVLIPPLETLIEPFA